MAPTMLGDPLDVAVGRAAAAGDHADPGGAAAEPGGRLLERLVGLQPRVLEDVGGRAERLRAVVAVLGAEAGLEVDQVVDLDRVAEVLAAQAAGGRDHGRAARRRGRAGPRGRRPRSRASRRGRRRPAGRRTTKLSGVPAEALGPRAQRRHRAVPWGGCHVAQYADRTGRLAATSTTSKGVRRSGCEVVTVRNEGRDPSRGSHRRPTCERRWSAARQSPNGRAAPERSREPASSIRHQPDRT